MGVKRQYRCRYTARLRDLGYYSDNVDGIFGANTYYAVVSFQSANGLNPDGIVGNATLERLGITTDVSYEDDLYTLASVINGEGRGEPYTGQVAIGAVVLNRVESDKFPIPLLRLCIKAVPLIRYATDR